MTALDLTPAALLWPLEDVARATGVSPRTVWRRVGEGVFPPPVRNGRRCVWPAREVHQIAAAMTAGRNLQAETEAILEARTGRLPKPA